jgi:hypothetical protein
MRHDFSWIHEFSRISNSTEATVPKLLIAHLKRLRVDLVLLQACTENLCFGWQELLCYRLSDETQAAIIPA